MGPSRSGCVAGLLPGAVKIGAGSERRRRDESFVFYVLVCGTPYDSITRTTHTIYYTRGPSLASSTQQQLSRGCWVQHVFEVVAAVSVRLGLAQLQVPAHFQIMAAHQAYLARHCFILFPLDERRLDDGDLSGDVSHQSESVC